jgi:hypothetical protein
MRATAMGVFLLGMAIVGCSNSPSGEVRALEKADSFVLYSLEPMRDPDTHDADYDLDGPGERLYGWRILGKTTISDESTRREVTASLKEGLDKGGMGAKCFYPRHAVRRPNGGKPIDLLICYECGNVELYRNGARVAGATVDRSGQTILDDALTEAGIPLAKKGKGHQESSTNP